MKTVLCFGDSNTHGTRAMRRPFELGWPSQIQPQLLTAAGTVFNVSLIRHPWGRRWIDGRLRLFLSANLCTQQAERDEDGKELATKFHDRLSAKRAPWLIAIKTVKAG